MTMQALTILLGRRIAFLRSTKGLNQSEFAGKLGICKSVLSRYEAGLRVPHFLLVEQMAQHLQLTLAHFATPGPDGLAVTITIAPPKHLSGSSAAAQIPGEP